MEWLTNLFSTGAQAGAQGAVGAAATQGASQVGQVAMSEQAMAVMKEILTPEEFTAQFGSKALDLGSLLNKDSITSLFKTGADIYNMNESRKLTSKQIEIANNNERRNQEAWDNSNQTRNERRQLSF